MRERSLWLQEAWRLEDPLAIRTSNFKKRTTRPEFREFGQFVLNFGDALRQGFFDYGADALEVASGGIIDRDFDAAAKAEIANPEERGERSGENDKIEKREPGADGEAHWSFTAPTE